jgi:trans-aconitate methyltransferase
MSTVQEFYNQIQFPGHYTIKGLGYHLPTVRNPYLQLIDQQITDGMTVLDVGCGTGLVSNLFGLRYPNSTFTSIDFASGIDFAKQFAAQNNINNVEFRKENFLEADINQTYDVVICQGVLHHIPDMQTALNKLKQATGKTLILGLYHPWGKWVKQWSSINYRNETLRLDQEEHPHETAHTCAQVKGMLPEFNLVSSYPSSINIISHIEALFNYRNGGLITYIFERNT